MEITDVETIEDYLAQTDIMLSSVLKKIYPKLNDYYENLKEKLFFIVHSSQSDLIIKLKQILAIDAQIQILLEIIKMKLSEYEEDRLLQILREDSKYFYRELIGLRMLDKAPFGIMFISENYILEP